MAQSFGDIDCSRSAKQVDDCVPIPLDYYYSGYPVSSTDVIDENTFLKPLKLNCGEDITLNIQTPFTFKKAGNYKLYGFIQLNMEVIFNGKPQIIDSCFIIPQPLSVVVVE